MAERLKILVIDNEEIIRALFERLVSSTPHLIALARNGREAVELLEKESFELMFVDASMRDNAGFSIAEQLFQSKGAALMVIMLSYSDAQIDSELNAIEPFAWLSKPFAIDEVIRLIEEASRVKSHGQREEK